MWLLIHTGVKATDHEAESIIQYSGVIMSAMVSQITSLAIVYSTVNTGTDQRKHQSSASLAFVRWIHRWPVISPHKGPVTRKMFWWRHHILTHMKRFLKTHAGGKISHIHLLKLNLATARDTNVYFNNQQSMAWRLFGARTSATTMLTQTVCRITGPPK